MRKHPYLLSQLAQMDEADRQRALAEAASRPPITSNDLQSTVDRMGLSPRGCSDLFITNSQQSLASLIELADRLGLARKVGTDSYRGLLEKQVETGPESAVFQLSRSSSVLQKRIRSLWNKLNEALGQ